MRYVSEAKDVKCLNSHGPVRWMLLALMMLEIYNPWGLCAFTDMYLTCLVCNLGTVDGPLLG